MRLRLRESADKAFVSQPFSGKHSSRRNLCLTSRHARKKSGLLVHRREEMSAMILMTASGKKSSGRSLPVPNPNNPKGNILPVHLNSKKLLQMCLKTDSPRINVSLSPLSVTVTFPIGNALNSGIPHS